MTEPALELDGVGKAYRFFQMNDISMRLEPGQILGFVGPNGAGKTTTIRILMGMVRQDRGSVRVLGHALPQEQAAAKSDIGFVSEDMRLQASATLAWHMRFVASAFGSWDAAYAATLLERFNLHPEQPVKALSHGERTKAALLLALATSCATSGARFCSRRTTRRTSSRSPTTLRSSIVVGSSIRATRRRSSIAGGGCTSMCPRARRCRRSAASPTRPSAAAWAS
jgi:hypothetical protein